MPSGFKWGFVCVYFTAIDIKIQHEGFYVKYLILLNTSSQNYVFKTNGAQISPRKKNAYIAK